MNADLASVLKMTLDLVTVIISLSLLLKGIIEYTKAQKWKQAEFVSREVKEFHNDFDVKRALIMLDWNRRAIDLHPGEIEGKTKLIVDDELIKSALMTHWDRQVSSVEQALIKKIFDTFFDRLTIFNNYITLKLISAEDIKPYLVYWITILAEDSSPRKTKEVRAQIWDYIRAYGYTDVEELCKMLGFEYLKATTDQAAGA
jgi:hypothetical protein